MKILLVFSCLSLSCLLSAQQLSKTTVTDLGSVGKLKFSIAKSDTVNVVSITQNGQDIRMVAIHQNEINEVVQTLNSFAGEIEKKADDKTVITYKTTGLLLSCSYFKATGWLIIIQNTDPALEQTSESIQRKTGYVIHHFVEIKPKQLQEVVKIFSKLLTPQAI